MIKRFNRFLLCVACLLGCTISAWADYDVTLRAYSNEPQKGLVFAYTASSPSPAANVFRSEMSQSIATGSRGAERSFWVWAIPARGYRFNTWSISSATKVSATYTGVADQLKVKASTSAVGVFTTNGSAMAGWTKVAAHKVTFKQAFGGNYKVSYQYRDVVKNRYNVYVLDEVTDEHSISAEQSYDTYATDEITLDAMALQGNGFIGWYKDGVLLSTNAQYTCSLSEVCTIECRTSGAQVRAKNSGTVEVASFPQTIPFLWDVQGVSEFTASEGTPSYNAQTGVVTVNKSVSAAGNYTITLNEVGNTITVAQLTNAKNVTKNTTGSLAALVSAASAGDKLQLMQDVTLTEKLTISKSLTLDLNGHVLSGAVDNLVYITGGDVTIDGTTAGSAIRSEVENQNACAVYAKGASLTINGGLYVATAKQESASANQSSNIEALNINAGTATITNATIEAEALNKTYGQTVYGVYVTSTGAVSLTGNTITVQAKTGAYGVYGAASTNLTTDNNTINVSASHSTGAYGIYTKAALTANDQVTVSAVGSNCYAVYADVTASGTVTGGKYTVTSGAVSGFGPINDLSKSAATLRIAGGFFNINTFLLSAMADNHFIYDVPSDAAEYAAGYRYEVSTQAEKTDIYVCTVYDAAGQKIISYKDLPSAFQMAINNPTRTLYIVMDAPYELPAGNYTLPANASLLIPHKAGQVKPYGEHPNRITERTTLAMYRELVFAAGVNIVVKGTLEISAQQFVQSAQTQGIGNVAGSYGQLRVNEGCNVWLDNGSKLCAWGYMMGNGNVQAKRGSRVYEMFQVYDWKGGTNLTEQFLDGHHGVFPINQYFIQNIEMPVTYRPGAQLLTSFGIVAANITYAVDNIGIIGPVKTLENKDTYIPCMFEMNYAADDEGVWVRKSYDPVNDRQVYEINHSASINAISMEIMGFQFTSSDYQLPITNNMHFHLLSGQMDITSDLVMLPGSEIEMDKESTVLVNEGKSVYLYDADQWDKYAFNQSNYAATVYYSPSWTGGVCPRATAVKTPAGLGDAKINIHGTLALDGNIYTSTNAEQTAGGANIVSTNADAGTFEFYHATGADASQVWQWRNVEQGNASKNFISATAPFAWLKNDDGSFAKTQSTADGRSYCFVNGAWTAYETKDCFVKDNYDKWYIKPSEYVEIKVEGEVDPDMGPEPNATTHLYTDKATESRFFLLDENAGCQWWEVTPVAESTYYYCAKNQRYYEYEDDMWQEVKVTVTFEPANGEDETIYDVKYGAIPEYVGDDPVKAQDATGSYTFKGWSSDGGTTVYKFEPMPAVTDDITYTAQYETILRKYLITLVNAHNGETVNVEYAKNATIDYAATKAEDNYYSSYNFDCWTPTTQPVTGEATYTASFSGVGPKSYTVRWYKEDGSTLLATATSSGGFVTWPAAADTYARPEDEHYTYAAKWFSSAAGETYAREDLPLVGEDVDYIAVFEGTPKKFTVTFKNYDGTVLETQTNMPYGTSITYSGAQPTKTGEDFDGWDPAFVSGVTTVPGNVIYTAQFSNVPAAYKYAASIIESNGTVHNYATLAEALSDINTWSNATFRLLSDVTHTSATSIALNKPITIDLNGHTFTSAIAEALFTVSANVTLMDGSTIGSGAIVSTDNTVLNSTYNMQKAVFLCVSSNVTITVNGGGIRSVGKTLFSVYLYQSGYKTLTNIHYIINDGNFVLNSANSSAAFYWSYLGSGSLTINGGTFDISGKYTGLIYDYMPSTSTVDMNFNGGSVHIRGNNWVRGIYLANGGTSSGALNVRGTNFVIEQASAIEQSNPWTYFVAYDTNSSSTRMGQQMHISGGSITLKSLQGLAALMNVQYGASFTGKITGGRFKVDGSTTAKTSLLGTTSSAMQVTGGFYGSATKSTINTELTTPLVPQEYSVVATDVAGAEYAAGYQYQVKPTYDKASVTAEGTTTRYESLADAVAAANAATDATVTLLTDVALASPVAATNSMVLDLNGYTLSGTTALLSMNAEGKTLRVVDNSEFGSGNMLVTATSGNARAFVVAAGTVAVESGKYKVEGGTTNTIFAVSPAEEEAEQKAFAAVSGGYFSLEIADYAADGYEQTGATVPGYPYTVQKTETYVASVTTSMGTQSFTTWEAAMACANANAGAIVSLLADIEVESTTTLTRAMTLDLNGYTLSGTKAILAVNAYGKTLTIRDNQNSGFVSINSATTVYAFSMGLGNLVVENGRFLMQGGAKVLQLSGAGASARVEGGYFSGLDVVGYVVAGKGLRPLTEEEKALLPGLNYVVDTEGTQHMVIFKDYNGAVLSQSLNMGGNLDLSTIAVPTRATDASNTYTFRAWKRAYDSAEYGSEEDLDLEVDIDEIFTAQYDQQAIVASVEANNSITYYYSWSDAVSAVRKISSYPVSMVLLADINDAPNTSLYVYKSLTLDLNGHTLSGTTSGSSLLYFSGDNANISIQIINSADAVGVIRKECTSGGAYAISHGQGTLTIASDKVLIEAQSSTGEAKAVNNTATLTISAGTFKASSVSSSSAVYAVYSSADAQIAGGKYSISGGSTSSSSACVRLNICEQDYRMSGGFFNTDRNLATQSKINDGEIVAITQAEHPTEYAEGYRYTFRHTNAVRVVQGGVTKEYPTLQEVLKSPSFTAGSTTTLLRDVTLLESGTGYLFQNASTSLDLAGHTVSSRRSDYLIYMGSGKTLIVDDSSAGKTGVMSKSSGSYALIQIQLSSSVTIKNGTFKTSSAPVFRLYENNNFKGTNTLTIEGGKFYCTSNYPITVEDYSGKTTITISGGYFTKNQVSYTKLSGGAYSSKSTNYPTLADFVVDGYAVATVAADEPEYKEGYRYKVVPESELPMALVTINGVGTEYENMADAITAVNNASSAVTLKLLKSVAIKNSTISPSQSFTLDMNGKALSGLDEYGTLLTFSGSGATSIVNSASSQASIVFEGGGGPVAVANTGSSLTINGNVLIECTSLFGIATAINNTAMLTVNNGTLKATGSDSYAGYAITSSGYATINGGKYWASGSVNLSGLATVNGGYFNVNPNIASNHFGTGYYAESITAGPIYDEGYRYAVVKAVASVTDGSVTTKYSSWASALAAANATSGATLKLLQDVTRLAATQVVSANNTTIDLNGHTIRGAANTLFRVDAAYATFCDNSASQTGAITNTVNTTAEVRTIDAGTVAGDLLIRDIAITTTNANTGSSNAVYSVYNKAELTVSDASISTTANRNAYAVYTENNTIIDGGSYTATSSYAGAYILYLAAGGVSNPTATVEDGIFESNIGGSLTTQGWCATAAMHNTANTTLHFKDGTVVVNGSPYANELYSFRTLGNLTIDGGTISVLSPLDAPVDNKVYGIKLEDGSNTHIAGGTFTFQAKQATYNIVMQTDAIQSLNIEGGNFLLKTATGNNWSINRAKPNANCSITGGYYNSASNMATYVPAGYRWNTLPTTHPKYADGYRYSVVSNTEYLVEFTDNSGTVPTNLFNGEIDKTSGSFTAKTDAETKRIIFSGTTPNIDPILRTDYGFRKDDVVSFGLYDFETSVRPTEVSNCMVFEISNASSGAPNPRQKIDGGTTCVELSNQTITDDQYSYIKLWHWVSGSGNTVTFSNYGFRGYVYKKNAASTIAWPNWRVVSENEVVSSVPTPNRPGYTFLGWYDAEEGGNEFDPSAPVTHDMKVWAHWKANDYTITFDQQSGQDGTAKVTATYGSAMPAATMPTRTGYVFGGYYSGQNGTGTQYYNADGSSACAWDLTANTTLYAKWTEIVKEARVNKADGTLVGEYYDFAEAVAAANSAASGTTPTLTVLSDVVLTQTAKLTKAMTLDLNGHTLSGTAMPFNPWGDDNTYTRYALMDCSFYTAGDVVITDNSASKNGAIRMTDNVNDHSIYAFMIGGGRLRLEAGTISATNTCTIRSDTYTMAVGSNTFTQNGGKVETITDNSIAVAALCGTTTINGGSVCARSSQYVARGLQVDGDANTITITDGTFETVSGYGAAPNAYSWKGAITISGGKFFSQGQWGANVSVSSNASSKAAISGGYFNKNTDLAVLLADGYAIIATRDEDLKKTYLYEVAESDPVATVRTAEGVTTNYYTWEAALAAAHEGSNRKLTLLADIELSSKQEIGNKNMTIDLNGHTINGSAPILFQIAAGEATFCDNSAAGGGKIVNTVASTNAVQTLYSTWGNTCKLTLQNITIETTNSTSSSNETRSVGSYSVLNAENCTIMTTAPQQCRSIYLYNSGTIKNCTVTAETSTGNNAMAIQVYTYAQNGVITINGGSYQASSANTGAYAVHATRKDETYTCDVTIHSGTFTSNIGTGMTAKTDCYHGAILNGAGTTMTINGGTVNMNGSAYANYLYALSVFGNLTINGGTFNVRQHADVTDGVIFAIKGEINSVIRIVDGVFDFRAVRTAYGIVLSQTSPQLTIEGGQFLLRTNTGENRNWFLNRDKSTVSAASSITGGYYSDCSNLASYVPAGYYINTLPTTHPKYAEGYRYSVVSKTEYLVEFTDNSGTVPTNLFNGEIDKTSGSFTAKTDVETKRIIFSGTTTNIDPILRTDYGFRKDDVVSFGLFDFETSVNPTSTNGNCLAFEISNASSGTPTSRQNLNVGTTSVEKSNQTITDDQYSHIKLWYWVSGSGNTVTFSDYGFRGYVYKKNAASTIAWPNWRVVSEKSTILSMPADPTRPGYTFLGWYDAEEGGNVFDPSAPITHDMKVWAHWKANDYTIIFDQQSGQGGTATVTATFDATMPAATMPTREDYVFGGYYSGQNGTGTQYYNADGSSARAWDLTNNTTLYAKWTKLIKVAKVTTAQGETVYYDWNTAFAAANDASNMTTLVTLSLLSDINLDSKQVISNKKLTIDLNGHIITAATNEYLFDIWSGHVTFTDSSVGKTGKIVHNASTTNQVRTISNGGGGGTLTVDGVTIETTNDQLNWLTASVYSVDPLTVQNCTITTRDLRYTYSVMHAGNATFTDNTITAISETADQASAIYASGSNSRTLSINGGTYIAQVATSSAATVQTADAAVTVQVQGGTYISQSAMSATANRYTNGCAFKIGTGASLNMQDATIEVGGSQYATDIRGLILNGDAVLQNSTITCNAATEVYGLLVNNGHAQLTDMTIHSQSNSTSGVARGVQVEASTSGSCGKVTIRGNSHISAVSAAGDAYTLRAVPSYKDGLAISPEMVIYNGLFEAEAANNTANFISWELNQSTTGVSGSAKLTVYDGKFKCTTTGYPANGKSNLWTNILVANGSVLGGYFTDNKYLATYSAASGRIVRTIESNEPEYAEGYRYQVCEKKQYLVEFTDNSGTVPTNLFVEQTYDQNNLTLVKDNESGRLVMNATNAGPISQIGNIIPLDNAQNGDLIIVGEYDVAGAAQTSNLTPLLVFCTQQGSFWINSNEKPLYLNSTAHEYQYVVDYERTHLKFRTYSASTGTINDLRFRAYVYKKNAASTIAWPNWRVKYTNSKLGTMPTDPTRPGYTFLGWYDAEEGGNEVNANTVVTHDMKVWAHWQADKVGSALDIVDWTASEITINANAFPSNGWPYTINEVQYEKTDRQADRTLKIAYSGAAGETVRISVTKTGESTPWSLHNYTIPVIKTADATVIEIAGGANAQLWVKGGTTTINANLSVSKVVVAPGADLVVNSDKKLTVSDKLVLRTTPWEAAALDNQGTISGDVYYSRVIADNSQYFQFGLPLGCSLADVRLSTGETPVYGSAWLLKSYSESSRATNGANGENWVAVAAGGSIEGTKGYEMFSNSKFYREYLFPVTLPVTNNEIAVSYTAGSKGTSHNGWNAVCSPLTRSFTQSFANPSQAVKVSELTEGGDYYQHIPTTIRPATPFYYQASAGQTKLVFGTEMTAAVASRTMEEEVQTEWLQLHCTNAAGVADETNFFLHPTDFTEAYETGYDVAKLSFTAQRPLLWSSLACGELAFAALPDSVATHSIPLTVYAPAAGSMSIALEQNDYLSRVAQVWLTDRQEGTQTDLLMGAYDFQAAQGTLKNRFYLNVTFKQQGMVTGVDELNLNKYEEARYVLIGHHLYILRGGVLYDLNGQKVK